MVLVVGSLALHLFLWLILLLKSHSCVKDIELVPVAVGRYEIRPCTRHQLQLDCKSNKQGECQKWKHHLFRLNNTSHIRLSKTSMKSKIFHLLLRSYNYIYTNYNNNACAVTNSSSSIIKIQVN